MDLYSTYGGLARKEVILLSECQSTSLLLCVCITSLFAEAKTMETISVSSNRGIVK